MPLATALGRETVGSLTPKQRFVRDLTKICGDIRFLWMPDPNDRATGLAISGEIITWDASPAARISAKGKGFAQTFDGVGNWGTAPDRAGLTFGTSLVDRPLTIVAVVNVTDTALERAILDKITEYYFNVTTTDQLELLVFDASLSVLCSRVVDAALPQGSWRMFATTYTAAQGGGATAGNDILLYQDGALSAGTVANAGTYVAMEDTSFALEIGSQDAHTTHFFAGSMGMILLSGKALTAAEHSNLKNLVNNYFGLSL